MTDLGGRDHPAFLKSLCIVIAITICGFLLFAIYEKVALGLPLVREEPALFEPYYLGRSAFAILMSALLVWVVSRGRRDSSTLDRVDLRPWQRTASLAVMAGALVCAGVFFASPELFGELAQEDRELEWASALFLFAGSGLFAASFLSRLRTRQRGDVVGTMGVGLAAGFSILFFLIGMEEISWMQRVVGFETPADVAEVNWQGEFNLHNIQTDLSETVYYFGSGLFLIFLPLLREAAPDWRLLRAVSDFIPGRAVAAVSAPVAIFNYGHWNLLPVQITTTITVFVLLTYAAAAWRRNNSSEALSFVVLVCSATAGQAVFLAYGQFMTYIPNATEFKEFFIALGLACFAGGVWSRRSAPRSSPADSVR